MNLRQIAIAITVCTLFLTVSASANSVKNIPISGTASYGFANTYGSFSIAGSSLSLYQALPEGPESIGNCIVGAVCQLSFTIYSSASFCAYCQGFSFGTLGNKSADFLDPTITFTGSALYSGGSTLTMPMSFSGIVRGYQLVGCTDGMNCSLGPQLFALHVSGTAKGTLTISGGNIYGASLALSGAAATIPEPTSLLLITTGITGIIMKKKLSS